MSQAMKSAESRLGVVRKVCDANIIWSDENMCVCVVAKKSLDSNIIRSDEKMGVCV